MRLRSSKLLLLRPLLHKHPVGANLYPRPFVVTLCALNGTAFEDSMGDFVFQYESGRLNVISKKRANLHRLTRHSKHRSKARVCIYIIKLQIAHIETRASGHLETPWLSYR
jgi:hypothetical protein